MDRLAPPRGTQDLLPDRADAMLGLYEAAHRLARAVRVPLRRDADVRAHRAVRAHVGRDLRRRDEGDVHVRGQGRPVRDAASGEHGRASCGPSSTHAQDLGRPRSAAYYVATRVPPRPPAGRPPAGVPPVRHRGDRRRGARRRRRGDRAGRPLPARARAAPLTPAPELDRRRGLPARLPGASSWPTSQPLPRRLDEDCRTRLEKNPLRVFDCKVDGEQGLRARRAHDRRPPVRAVRRALRGGPRRARRGRRRLRARPAAGARASTTTRARRSSGSPACSPRTRPARSTPAAATTGSPRRSAARRRPGSGSRWASTACCWRWRARASPCRRPASPRCFVVAIGDDGRAAGRRLVEELRDAGVPRSRAFEERPLKAQLKHGRPRRRRVRRDPRASGSSPTASSRCAASRDGVQKTVPRRRRGPLAHAARRLETGDER